ncbi:hypothetical protein Pyn_16535 [Prunus yedoensis var. nudiflora]|uniref:Uncharacterized protein n=1 Tax=Prunus yedoensis var. nudiflora TaxID=2094558 RepID=A0A314V467_PRUYE|nr:hypothetical protein Pyn_16535 [Prunus yedoensis var. nudiflora]
MEAAANGIALGKKRRCLQMTPHDGTADYDDDAEGMITEDSTIINVHEEKGCADYEDELVV